MLRAPWARKRVDEIKLELLFVACATKPGERKHGAKQVEDRHHELSTTSEA